MTVWRSCNEAAQIQTISPDGPNPWIHWIYFTYPFWEVCRERCQKEDDGQTCCLPGFNVLFFSLITKTKSDFCFQKNATFTIISEQQLLFVAQNYFCFFPTSHIWEHRGSKMDEHAFRSKISLVQANCWQQKKGYMYVKTEYTNNQTSHC